MPWAIETREADTSRNASRALSSRIVNRGVDLPSPDRSMQFSIAERTHANEVRPMLLKEIGTDKPLEDDSRCLDSDSCVSNHLAYGDDIARVHSSEHCLEPCPDVRIGCCAHARHSAQWAFRHSSHGISVLGANS